MPALAVVILLIPSVSHAAFGDWVEGLISEGGGTVTSETVSAVSTGGQTAGAGESVQTGSASASVTSVINASSGGGTVEVTIETEQDGVVSTETRTEEFGPEGVSITVGTSTGSASTSAKAKYEHVYQNNESDLDFIARVAGGASSTATTTSRTERALTLVSNILKRVFAFIWRF